MRRLRIEQTSARGGPPRKAGDTQANLVKPPRIASVIRAGTIYGVLRTNRAEG